MKLALLFILTLTLAAAQSGAPTATVLNAKEKEKEQVKYINPSEKGKAQNPHQSNVGIWLTAQLSKETSFPRYLICGAEMTYSKLTMPYSCNITKIHNQPIIITCEGGKPIWERTNGIRFKYCNFEDWDDQRTQQHYGSWEWTGMRTCPRNQFVYGYSTKINPNDGINGLYLYCRNKFTGQNSIITVREGKGTVIGPQLTNPAENYFAYDYSIKIHEDNHVPYITGLKFSYTPFPSITSIDIQYESLPPWDIRVEYLPSVIRFQNVKDQDVKYDFDQNRIIRDMLAIRANRTDPRMRSFTYSMSNFRSKYHNYPMRRFLKENFVLSVKMPVIRNRVQEDEVDVDRKVVFRLRDLPSDFQFGKVFNQPIHTYEFLKFPVPKCRRIEITNIIYSSIVSNPYLMTIVYTSGTNSFTEKIRGIYQGELFGRPEVNLNYFWSCR